MTTIYQVNHWVGKGEELSFKNGEITKAKPLEKFHRFFSKKTTRRQVQQITEFIKHKLSTTQGTEHREYLKLADILIRKHQGNRRTDRIMKVFDRIVVRFRSEIKFEHRKNKDAYQKWRKYGMSPKIYQKHPEFCSFMETSGLLSQIKVTRDAFKEIDGEPAISVNGSFMKWTEFKNTFEVMYSKRYREKFITHKDTRETYTYLDNGKGLQPHHPYLTELTPISKLNEEDYEKVLAKAQTFVRPGEENLSAEEKEKLAAERPYVLQLVSSYTKGPNTRAHRLLSRSKHPYIRLVAGGDNALLKTQKGDVFEVGYGWRKRVMIPLVATQGQFRSPDIWEYGHCEERVVTNIPISQEEAQNLYKYTMKYHRDGVNLGNPIGFHFTRQNCSTYVRQALLSAGIKVPTEIALPKLLRAIAPKWMTAPRTIMRKAGAKVFKKLPKGLQYACMAIDQTIVKLARGVLTSVITLSLVPFRIMLGGASGAGGRAFTGPKETSRNIEPDLKDVNSWYRLSSYRFNLPGILQQWQRQQKSTVITKKPIKLTIVP